MGAKHIISLWNDQVTHATPSIKLNLKENKFQNKATNLAFHTCH